MKYPLCACLIAAGLLLNADAVNAKAQDSISHYSLKESRRAAPKNKEDSSTATITGCLLNGSATKEYLLIGPQNDQWIVRSDNINLGAHLYRRVKVTVHGSNSDALPLSVVSIRSARPGCSVLGYWGGPLLIASLRCTNLPC